MLKNKKAVMLDAADTLFYIKNGLGKTYASPARKYGVDPDPIELKKAFSRHFNSAPPLAFPDVINNDNLKILEKQWWYDVVKNVYNDVGMFEYFNAYFEDLFEIFRNDAWEIYPETIDVLTRLKKSGYKIIMVTNFDSRVYDVLKRLGIYEIADDIVISSEAGYAKPDIEIYRLALKRNNLDPSECIFVGDNYINDYVTPISIGIDAVLLNRNNENDKYKVKHINNLNQLISND